MEPPAGPRPAGSARLQAVPRAADSPCGLPFSGLSLASAGRPGHHPGAVSAPGAAGDEPYRQPSWSHPPPPPPQQQQQQVGRSAPQSDHALDSRGVVRFVASLERTQPGGRAALAAPLPRHVTFPSYPEPVAEFPRSMEHVPAAPHAYEPPRPAGGSTIPQLRVTDDAVIAPPRLSGPSYQQPTYSSLQKVRHPTEQQLETADWLLHRRGSGLTDSSRRSSAAGDSSRRGSTMGDSSRRGSTMADSSRRGSTMGDSSRRSSAMGDRLRRSSGLTDLSRCESSPSGARAVPGPSTAPPRAPADRRAAAETPVDVTNCFADGRRPSRPGLRAKVARSDFDIASHFGCGAGPRTAVTPPPLPGVSGGGAGGRLLAPSSSYSGIDGE